MGQISVKFRFNHWLPKLLGVEAIVLYPIVFFSLTRELVSEVIICHEMIHVRQVRRLGWFRFYFLYLWEYFVLRVKGRSKLEAYRKISFEQEAFLLAEQTSLSAAERQEAGLV